MDAKTKYDLLCTAVKKMLAAQEDADNNKTSQTKKVRAFELKKEVIVLMNPEKRIVSQATMMWEGK